MADIHPHGAELVTDKLLSITWSDGATLHYPAHMLRASCPCAHCAPSSEDKPPLDPNDFMQVDIRSVEELGTYAFQIGFNDGHNIGIYSYARLRSLGFAPGESPAPTAPEGSFEV